MKDKQLKIILKKNSYLMVLYLIFMIGFSVLSFFEARYSADFIAAASNNSMDVLVRLLIVITIFGISIAIMELICSVIMNALINKIKYQYSVYLSKHSRELKTDTVEASSSNAIANHVLIDPINAMGWVSNIFNNVSLAVYHAVLSIYIMCFNLYFGIFMFVFFALSLVLMSLTMKKRIKYGNISRKASIFYSSVNSEAINSHQDIKTLNSDNFVLNNIDKTHKVMDKARYKFDTYTNYVLGSNNYIGVIYEGLIPIILSVLIGQFELAIASAIFMFNYSQYIRTLNDEIMNTVGIYTSMKVNLNSIDDFMNPTIYPVDTYGNVSIEKLKGDIEFKNVSFNYKYKYYKEAVNADYETLYNDEFSKKRSLIEVTADEQESEIISKTVFEDLSFKIDAGQTVAFVGQSGSGKTTILNLIAKFSQCDSGEVLLDGVNINDLTKDTLRNNICMVSQNTYIFNGTIKENLKLVKPNASDEELMEACKRAYMENFLNELEKGLDTVVGENGIKLSGGQKQRLAIARAFLRDSSIVIFDESTSALDNEAQSYVQNSISELKGRTIIIVAHRLSTIINADCIYYLQEGKVTSKGTFDELMENDESFKELFMTENI